MFKGLKLLKTPGTGV